LSHDDEGEEEEEEGEENEEPDIRAWSRTTCDQNTEIPPDDADPENLLTMNNPMENVVADDDAANENKYFITESSNNDNFCSPSPPFPNTLPKRKPDPPSND
jgi:hypothetical protein